MSRIVLPVLLLLYLLQIYILLQGVSHFSKLQTPFILFAISILIAIVSVRCLFSSVKAGTELATLASGAIGASLGLLSIVVCYPSLRSIFDRYNYTTGSDVIPQLETLFNRFNNGIFPYYPLEQFSWHPYPVYMPLNWLPIGLADPLHCDVRWIGVLFLAVAASAWGAYVWMRKGVPVIPKIIAVCMPSLAIWGYIRWCEVDLGVSLETLITAYYLVLALGLASRNLWLITAGIILCLLSRYTMIFWLPLFLIILWQNAPKRKSLRVWAAIAASILFIYLVPFYFHDPSILSKGIAYHNRCYVDMWNGLGHPEQATVFDSGLTFSWYVREFTSGLMEARVQVGRTIQAIIMLLLLLGGYVGYRRWKEKINFYDYGLLMLYVILICFFMSSPAVFYYYYMPVLAVSAVLCARTVLSAGKFPDSETL